MKTGARKLSEIKKQATRVRTAQKKVEGSVSTRVREHKKLQTLVKRFPKRELEFYAERIAQVVGAL